MIRIAHPEIETKIDFDSGKTTLLIIENPHAYYNAVSELIKAFNGELSDFTFWKDDKQVGADKYGDMLYDLFTFKFGNKKILTALQKQLLKNYLDGEYIVEFQRINGELQRFLHKLCDTVDFATEFDEPTVEELLKSCSVRPVEKYDSFLEKIICYINLISSVKPLAFFIFFGLKDLLSDEELMTLYRHCRLQKISLLLLESSKKRPLIPLQERAIIITEDLCEIVEKIEDF